jgi:outer membrane protein OmpA-like peptidoglycan-associated protein/Tol biopolymer transport system component
MKNILILLLFPFILFSQNTPKAKKAYAKAVELFEVSNDKKAKDLLMSAIRHDNNYLPTYLLLGQIEEEQGNIQLAIDNYLKGLSDNNPDNAWGYWKVGMLYMQKPDYVEAKRAFTHFLTFKYQRSEKVESARKELKNCEFSIDAMANPKPFDFKNMGEGVNSEWEEYLPSVSADGKLFVITRRGPYQNGIVSEDFFQSVYKDGKWSMAQNLGPSVNTMGNEGAQCLSPNGKVLFFTACDRKDGLGRCDIYISVKRNGQWSEARNIGPSINTKHWESQPTISPDGRELYFVSNRPEGYGGMDIWKSVLTEKGTFSEPVNLGSTINTSYDEMSPFIHTDNQTLYFASKGHPGLGDFDLFLSRRDYPSASWQYPINLGYPINTHGIENSLIVGSDGKTAYFASDKSGYGKEDIFWFHLPQEMQSQQVAYLNTNVYDAETKTPMKSSVEIIDLATGKVMISSFTYTKTGEFFTCLPANANYAVNVSKEGYLFHSENFALDEQSALQALELDIPLQRLNKGSKIVLNNIFFDTDAYSLKDESEVELNTLVNFMRNNAMLKVEIEGHTDNVGTETHNTMLSTNRAKAVYDFLVDNGIDANRMTYKGFGASQPIATNDTEKGRATNRRTAFRVK